MMVSEEFKKNVELGDVVTVRSVLVDYLIIDTLFHRFDEALEYAEKSMEVVESDDGQQNYDLTKENWDEAYLNKQKVALMVNFSQKRIDHIKQVIGKVLVNKSSSDSKTVKEMPVARTQGVRTGRTVLSEEPISRSKTDRRANLGNRVADTASKACSSRSTSRNSYSSNESRTGRRIVGEKSSGVKKTEEEIHPVDIAAWLIGGGIAVAAVGGVTAGIGAMATKPAVLHAGLAVAGVGGMIAISGGAIKIVREN